MRYFLSHSFNLFILCFYLEPKETKLNFSSKEDEVICLLKIKTSNNIVAKTGGYRTCETNG